MKPIPDAIACMIAGALFMAAPAMRANVYEPRGVDGPVVPRKFVPPPPAPSGDILKTPPAEVDGYVQLDFDRLAAFLFTPPDYDPVATPNRAPPSVDGQIPEPIKALDGRRAVITGFMLPVEMDGAYVSQCMLLRSRSLCCYGMVPNVNEWVVVKMKPGANMPPLMDVPVSIYGTFHVHGSYENGYLVGIYFLDGERMEQTKAPGKTIP